MTISKVLITSFLFFFCLVSVSASLSPLDKVSMCDVLNLTDVECFNFFSLFDKALSNLTISNNTYYFVTNETLNNSYITNCPGKAVQSFSRVFFIEYLLFLEFITNV